MDLIFPVPTEDQKARALALREGKAAHLARREESFERCDTDGFLSQWADGLTASLQGAQATILEQGGMDIFRGLYRRSDGARVRAKLIHTQYGTAWAFCDAAGKFTGKFLNDAKNSPRSKLWKEGYEVREELAPAWARLAGRGHGLSGSCWVQIYRKDGGYPPDAA